jgi:hypothetical protein
MANIKISNWSITATTAAWRVIMERLRKADAKRPDHIVVQNRGELSIAGRPRSYRIDEIESP